MGHLNSTDWHISLETGFSSSHAGCRHKPRLFSLFREPHRGFLSIESHPMFPGPSDPGQANRICVKSVPSLLQNPKGLQQGQPPIAMHEQREKMVRFDFPSYAKRKGKSSWLLEKHCRSGKRECPAPVLHKPEILSLMEGKHFPNSQRNAEASIDPTNLPFHLGVLKSKSQFQERYGNCH